MVSQELLEILRCPKGVQEGEGLLELYQDVWLVCDQTGYKYPIIDDIPVMLIEVGEQFKDTAKEELPVPPPRELIES
ncbi:MAG: Trm112 family protein [Chloroflexi bacterium]|nr:MAG: Trm112 family protein [Chloroflexota bacterium]MBL1193326.1 Trm112 family protein [Chloroflexota bacterium]NOH10618.1 Trm112 family protein [Chloroflexota bacterium]